MSLYSVMGGNQITKRDIKKLLDHNDIKAYFFEDPLEAEIQLGCPEPKATIAFNEKELRNLAQNGEGSFEEKIIKAIADRINEGRSNDRKEIIDEIRLLNNLTDQRIVKYREYVYNKYLDNGSECISEKEFFDTKYRDKQILEMLSKGGDEKIAEWLALRDPLLNNVETFANIESLLNNFDLQHIIEVLDAIIIEFSDKELSITASLILTNISHRSPEETFDEIFRDGAMSLSENIKALSSDEIQELQALMRDFEDEINERPQKNLNSGKIFSISNFEKEM